MKSIYLIACNSYHILKKKIAEIANGNTNITYESLNELTLRECLDDASYMGLFSEERVIVIKDVKYFGGKFNYEEDTNLLLNFLESCDLPLTLIFVCDSLSKSKDSTKKVIELGATLYDLDNLSESDILKELEEYANVNNLQIKEDVLMLVYNNCLKDIDLTINELDKLSLVDKNITKEIVTDYGIKVDNIDAFAFSNAVIEKNVSLSFSLFEQLLNNGVEVFALLGVLASSFANMYMVRDASLHGLSDEEIAKKLGYSSTGRVYVLKKNAKIYTTDELKDIIVNLSNLDIKLKNGYDPVHTFQEFLLSL